MQYFEPHAFAFQINPIFSKEAVTRLLAQRIFSDALEIAQF